MSRVHQRGRARIEANLTPMIDMTFLLIVFFVLVSQITEIEVVKLDLPRPTRAATQPLPDEQRSVINVLPGEDGAVQGYRVNAMDFPATVEGVEAMTAYLVRLYEARPDLNINLRADRSTDFRWVQPAMTAATTASGIAAGIQDRTNPRTRINLVVIKEQNDDGT